MRKLAILGIFLMGSFVAGLALAQSQAPPPEQATPSLGALAKKLRAERKQEGQKPAKVYTNDNIPRQGGLSTAGTGSASSEGESSAAGEATKPAGKAAKTGAHDEKYYSEQMQELQSQKAMHERELAVLQQKLNLNETQYYADPNKNMNHDYIRGDINKKQDEIAKKKQQIADDEKAIADLEAQCQREGCPPGWLR
jgi:hypothetical protein